MTDSTIALNYINKMEGTKSYECNKVARDVWEMCRKNNIWITCAHVPGIENLADKPLRELND